MAELKINVMHYFKILWEIVIKLVLKGNQLSMMCLMNWMAFVCNGSFVSKSAVSPASFALVFSPRSSLDVFCVVFWVLSGSFVTANDDSKSSFIIESPLDEWKRAILNGNSYLDGFIKEQNYHFYSVIFLEVRSFLPTFIVVYCTIFVRSNK